MNNILEIKDLSVHFGGIKALDNISFNLPQGKIVTLIGSNGAGKTTSVRSICGLVRPLSGQIIYNGQEIVGLKPEQIVSLGITMVPEGRKVFDNLTVLENLKMGAYLRNDDISSDIEYVYSLFPRLLERNWQLAGTLSGGEQQMLAVGRALMARPKLILMDEPSLGLAPLVVRDIFSIIKEINKNGITVLLNEQNANMALKIADYGYVVEHGTITMEGTGQELLTNEAIKEAYLGKKVV